MGWLFLLFTTIGRKSGKRRITPLEYHRINGEIHIFSLRGDKADFVRNLRANLDKAKVRHGFHWFDADCVIIKDLEEIQ